MPETDESAEDSVTVSDGVNTATVFTFYTGTAGTTTQYNRAVNISGATSAADVAAILVTAMTEAMEAARPGFPLITAAR